MPRARPTIRQWQDEINRLAQEARNRGHFNRYTRLLNNLRVSNQEAEARARLLATRYGLTSNLLDTISTAAAASVATHILSTTAATPASPAQAPTIIPAIDDLTFGVEIEMLAPSRFDRFSLAREIGARAEVACNAEGYNHRVSRSWKLTTDASVHGTAGFQGWELVSPVLRGADGLAQLGKVLDVLVELGCTVNRSCGMHVHIGAASFGNSVEFFKNLVLIYGKNEKHLDSLVAPSRRTGNQWCKPLRFNESDIDRATSIGQVCHAIGQSSAGRTGGRFKKLNLEAFWQYSTVEFRHHQGSVERNKVLAWVRLCMRLVLAAAKATSKPAPAADLLELLVQVDAHPDEVAYFARRYVELRRATPGQE